MQKSPCRRQQVLVSVRSSRKDSVLTGGWTGALQNRHDCLKLQVIAVKFFHNSMSKAGNDKSKIL